MNSGQNFCSRQNSCGSLLEKDVSACVRELDLTPLAGRAVLITGATGLLGRLLVLTLLHANRIGDLNLRILAAVRDPAKASAMFEHTKIVKGLHVVPHDLCKPLVLEDRADYVLHCAAPTQSRFFVEHPLETIAGIVDGTRHVLEYALQSRAVSVVYLSSLEIYGEVVREDVAEKDYGYLDPLQARSSYPEAKRLAECLCFAYCKQHAVPVKIARLTQTFGAGVQHDDPRVFAEFARCVLEGRNIVLRTPGETRRAYCYTTDAVSALLTILLRGENGQAYNVANRTTYVSIRELAEAMANGQGGMRVVVEPDQEERGYNPTLKINLRTDKLEALGWKPSVGMEEMIDRLLEGMRQERQITEGNAACRIL